MPRITVLIREDERKALTELSYIERREFRQQAAILIRQGLEMAGLLQPPEQKGNDK